MEISSKQQIKMSLANYVQRFDSQKRAANSLRGVSDATISQILNDNHEQVSEVMWRNIKSQIDFSYNAWVTVETQNFRAIRSLLADAKEDSMAFCVIGASGCGKTETESWFAANTKRSYLLKCDDFWNKRIFLVELLRSIGGQSNGLSIGEMVSEITRLLKRQEKPIVIIDEIDKLPDPVLFFFISLYNRLEGLCGIVLIGSPYLRKRIERGVRLGKKGYEEIYSRLGGKFIELSRPGSEDIVQICMANGLTGRSEIKKILDEGTSDLRRVKNMVYALKKQRLTSRSSMEDGGAVTGPVEEGSQRELLAV